MTAKDAYKCYLAMVKDALKEHREYPNSDYYQAIDSAKGVFQCLYGEDFFAKAEAR